jgi:hypothetical protein
MEQMLSGATVKFYAELRWAGWESAAELLEFDQGLTVYPPPFTLRERIWEPPAARPCRTVTSLSSSRMQPAKIL